MFGPVSIFCLFLRIWRTDKIGMLRTSWRNCERVDLILLSTLWYTEEDNHKRKCRIVRKSNFLLAHKNIPWMWFNLCRPKRGARCRNIEYDVSDEHQTCFPFPDRTQEPCKSGPSARIISDRNGWFPSQCSFCIFFFFSFSGPSHWQFPLVVPWLAWWVSNP